MNEGADIAAAMQGAAKQTWETKKKKRRPFLTEEYGKMAQKRRNLLRRGKKLEAKKLLKRMKKEHKRLQEKYLIEK